MAVKEKMQLKKTVGMKEKTLNFSIFLLFFENQVKVAFYGIKFVVSIDLFVVKLKYFFFRGKKINNT